MPDSPFATTNLRRFWTFVGLWAMVIVSIISYITTPRASGIPSTLQIVGIYYYNSQVALNEFAQAATVPEWVVLLTYGILALILLGITVGLLLTRIADIRLTGLDSAFLLLTMTSISVVISAVFVSTILLGHTVVIDMFDLVLQITPPILTLSPVAVVISIITSYIP